MNAGRRPAARNHPGALLRASALALSLAGGTAHVAIAAEYPVKPIRIVVGFAPGGGTDTTTRALAPKLSAALGQQIVVDNRPGAAGNIGTDLVAKAPADGYTLLMGTIAALAINPSLYEKLPFDPVRDFAPISRGVDSTNVLVVHPSVPAKTVKELIALAKKRPGDLNYGSSGVGGAGHLAGELFNLIADTKLVHVPYKGGAPAMVDLIAGHVHMIFATAATANPQIKAGKIRPLAVTTLKRAVSLPDVPTLSEAGIKGFEANNWYGLLAPAKTPRPIIDRLNREFVAALRLPDVKEFLLAQGLEPAPSTPEEFADYIKAEMAKWAKVVKASGAKVN
ncbi:MAG: tripartite tricarboxylate transporter substrate binding protein [Betaproteobacteria bacterium]|nr:tripartite tricarboxylate transporter substrate binding protein [Betaproteobacteria bacterium]